MAGFQIYYTIRVIIRDIVSDIVYDKRVFASYVGYARSFNKLDPENGAVGKFPRGMAGGRLPEFALEYYKT